MLSMLMEEVKARFIFLKCNALELRVVLWTALVIFQEIVPIMKMQE